MIEGAGQQKVQTTAKGALLDVTDAMRGVRNCDVATGLTRDTIKMITDTHQQDRDRTILPSSDPIIQWRSRYGGLVTIAELGGKAVAGISGPWSDQYALTWWDRPLPTRSLDLFNSVDEAKHTVEHWAQRMRCGNYSALDSSAPANNATQTRTESEDVVAPNGAIASPSSQPSLIGWVRELLLARCSRRPRDAITHSVERLRRKHASTDADLGQDLHFSAEK